jgi:protein gp37
MAENTGISWTQHTFNLAWGCVKISPGCTNCYADTLSHRFGNDVWGKDKPRKTFNARHWKQPLKWNANAEKAGVMAKVFSSSMCDIFEDHPTITQEREKLWELIRKTPNLVWQLLTKRANRIKDNLPPDWGNGWPNVWLGVSIENNDYVSRADYLREVPAVVHFISYEPALGPLDQLNLDHIEWLIYGGESGAGFREHDPEWARDIKRRCEENGTTFFYKQSSGFVSGEEDTLDGVEYKNFPLYNIELAK